MTKEALAAMLTGRSYGSELSKAEETQAKADGLVVVFGASDDLMEFRGAIHDEVGCYDSGAAFLAGDGLLTNRCEADDDCPYFEKMVESAPMIEALWCSDEPSGPSWSYKTTIPHATFEIHDEEEFYCRGIVFALSEVPR